MPAYTITPEDILFFRDGRPMETAGGHGARWPEPSVIFDALHAALHRAFPDAQGWEHSHRYGRSSDRDMSRPRAQRFGSLATAGPFPAWKDGRWLFPAPADATSAKEPATWLLRPYCPKNDPSHQSNLPAPLHYTASVLDAPTHPHKSHQSNLPATLSYPVASFAPPTKDTPSPWWSAKAWQTYLAGNLPDRAEQFTDDDIFAREWHTGIAIDPATQTTGHGETAGKIYAAQYLRLREGVSMGIQATMPMKNGQPDQRQERISQLFPANRTLIVGGQQRVCQVEEILDAGQPVPLGKLLPVSPPITGTRVKWVLLSPAVFPAIPGGQVRRPDGTEVSISPHPGGWLPSWVDVSWDEEKRAVRPDKRNGQVLLKPELPRPPGESRKAWRERVRKAPFLNCRLVAAVIPKPIVLTGWTEALHLKDTPWQREHGPRPTLLAVPAGAVYYFEADSAEAAAQLAAALNWHGADTAPATIRNRRSTLLGEKGFGLGVCGPWQFYKPDPSDRSQPSDPSA